jgi:Photosynthesis system II assembly factor YCF48
MEKLPNTVRDRMSGSRAGSHPDAELLNAFAEQVATERERISILDHLAGCSACRQVLALSAPELSPVAATLSPNTSDVSMAAWFRWRTLKWASMAACVVVVGAAATLWRTERHSQFAMTPQSAVNSDAYSASGKQAAPESSNVAQLAQPAEAPVPAEKKSGTRFEKREAQSTQSHVASSNATYDSVAKAKAEPAAGAPAMKLEDEKPAVASLGAASTSSLASSRAGSPGSHDADNKTMIGSATTGKSDTPTLDIAANENAPTSPPAAAKEQEQVHTGTEMVELQSQTVPANSLDTAAKDHAKFGLRRDAAPAQRAAGAKAGLTQQNLAERAAIAPGASIMKDLVNARWTLSPDGLPQRSLDSGKTWEKMHVDNLSGFRALSAAGLEVWVGGLGGLLYHTNDVGMHWSRVKPVVEGTPLSADILRIDFVDAQHGKLVTADQHVWTTADAGKSWQRN